MHVLCRVGVVVAQELPNLLVWVRFLHAVLMGKSRTDVLRLALGGLVQMSLKEQLISNNGRLA